MLGIMCACSAWSATETGEECSHSNCEQSIKVEPTCTEQGVCYKLCKDCGWISDEYNIDATGHMFGNYDVVEEATCTDAGTKLRVCSVCGEEEKATISAVGHTYGTYVVVKEATYTETGIKEATCTVCGNKKQEKISTLTPTKEMSNALKAAKNYLSVMPFSRKSLIKQLEFEGYSTAASEYAVDECNADWKEQAVKAAKKYLDVMPFSRSRLISQLEYEGFTHEQAVYGVEQNGY